MIAIPRAKGSSRINRPITNFHGMSVSNITIKSIKATTPKNHAWEKFTPTVADIMQSVPISFRMVGSL